MSVIRNLIVKIFHSSTSLSKDEDDKPDCTSHILNIPDNPCAFGYKISWLAIKCDSPKEVIKVLNLSIISDCNWAFGINSAYDNNKIFVSPCLDGFVLVIGADDEMDEKKLITIGKNFDEIQYFSTHRVTEYHKWVKILHNKIIRGYGYLGETGEVVMDVGDISSEEDQLGFSSYINKNNQDGDWELLQFPNEESVLKIADAWGIDPKFETTDYPKSTGYLCTI